MAPLRELREKRRWSRKTLAEKADLAPATIARIEAGEGGPVWETVRRICTALGVERTEVDEFEGLFP